ncbi:dipeptide ABC transporter ATP-binding protein [Prosthecodimorpha staleyi]|uniref:ABC transporter ATP-binding protein n=1 Tax=Prosthecodimorpha staleyi TaxID=2840188 RepID=A0A947D6R5_9HYPH|nr:ABC transporter ATP-binding protein [Prosthecodimorpha staleyi]MBT9292108.1 ABC transporter ATP-binding protein [Prosthecodimorpha staleyi]
MNDAEPLLSVRNLTIGFPGRPEPTVADIAFDVAAGRVTALVGESGSGKSLTAAALLGLLPGGARCRSGQMRFDGRDCDLADPRAVAALRGGEIGMIFQEPMTALNPVLTVGEQIAEGIVRHRGLGWRAAGEEAIGLLDRVGIPEPRRRARQYLHQLSGGMRQRVMIASALACRPKLIVADEATTALDVTIQAQILDLLADLQAKEGLGVLFITHDLGIVAEIADHVAVMRAGRIVETGATATVIGRPQSPYTRALIDALPGGAGFGAVRGGDAGTSAPLLEVRGLVKTFPVGGTFLGGRRTVTAVAGVDIEVRRGEVMALVGESGSGKTTIGRCIVGLETPSAGTIQFAGGGGLAPSAARRRIQIVFQDPYSSLNPKLDVAVLVGEAIAHHGLAHGADVRRRVGDLLDLVGLDRSMIDRRPAAFSGGQRQRIAIARALAVEPDLLVADEAVSALDVSVRAQIVRLLADLRDRLGLAILFITHDLALVRHFADRVAVLYLGEVMEEGPVEAVFAAPRHPYTRALLDAEPDIAHAAETARGRRSSPLSGDLPSPIDRPRGCPFSTRCPSASALCKTTPPPMTAAAAGHRYACHHPLA